MRVRGITWSLFGRALVVLLILGVAALPFFWRDGSRAQAILASLSLLANLVLVYVTWEYVKIARSVSAATDLVNLEFRLILLRTPGASSEDDPTNLAIQVANLSARAVFVTHALVRLRGDLFVEANRVVASGQVECLGFPYGQLADRSGEIRVDVSLRFKCLGRTRDTEYRAFVIEIHNGKVVGIDAA